MEIQEVPGVAASDIAGECCIVAADVKDDCSVAAPETVDDAPDVKPEIAETPNTEEDCDDLFYSVTSAGYQVVAKDGLQRKLQREYKKYGFPKITDGAVLARLRRMNDIYAKITHIPDCNIIRPMEP